jgi:hypothetical protein
MTPIPAVDPRPLPPSGRTKPTAEQKRWTEIFVSMQPYKRALLISLAEAREKATSELERRDIDDTILAYAFRSDCDLYGENIKDVLNRSSAEEVLKAHRLHVANNVIKFRKQKGWLQEDLAAASGLPQSFISRIETCKHCSTAKTISALAKGLGVRKCDIDLSFDD